MSNTVSDNQFWSSPTTEPKRAYRFMLSINGIESWAVKKVKRPDYDLTEISHDYIAHKFWYPGRVEWKPVTFTMVDPIKPDSTGILLAHIIASGYRLPSTEPVTRTPNKMESVAALGSVEIYGFKGSGASLVKGAVDSNVESVLEPAAEFHEKWTLKNAWIKTVEMGEYDYGTDAIIDLTVTMRYDWAEYTVVKGTTPSVDQNLWAERASPIGKTDLVNAVLSNAGELIAGNPGTDDDENPQG